jgi:predicted aspartyl protease
MKASRPKRFLLFLTVAVVIGISPDAVAQSRCNFVRIAEWPVRLVGGHIVVDGAINGKKVAILLDTGAQRSIMLRSAAVRLDLPRHELRGSLMYAMGRELRLETATVEEFKLGDAASSALQLIVAGESNLAEGVDMLLGEDFLHNFDVEFDLAHRSVRLFAPKNCDGVSLAYWTREVPGEVEIEPVRATQLAMAYGEGPQIAFTVKINDRPIRAILDSGAPSSVLTREHAEGAGVSSDSPGVVRSAETARLDGKRLESWTAPFRTFAIGNETIDNPRIQVSVLYTDNMYSQSGRAVARVISHPLPMLLGTDFLQSHRTLVSHSQRRMYFTYIGGPVFAGDPPTAANK